MSMDDTNAFSALNQLMIPNNLSPLKMPMDDQMLKLFQNLPGFQMLNQLPSNPMLIQTANQENQQQFGEVQPEDKPSPSNDSESSTTRQTVSPDSEDAMVNTSGILSINAFPNSNKSVNQKNEGWYECFTTTSKTEYDALIYSLYVIDKDERKMDGWQYFECLNRLQNKCKFKVRCKKQDEFYIFEERSSHNHGIEPVGQAGSHAGLPKTLREIVDRSFNESWAQEVRSSRIDEEVRRLGLPPNPRLGRQIDNRVAYLRRVKNLNETKKIQDQLTPTSAIDTNNIFNAQMLQLLMDQNGGSLTVEKDIVEKLINQQQQQQQGIEKMETNDIDQNDPSFIIQQLINQQQQQQAENMEQYDEPSPSISP